jgi:hypothetical protein
MNALEYLKLYRTLTLEIMDKIKKDEEIDSLISKRDEILEALKERDFSKEEIIEIGNSLKLLELEEELEALVIKERAEIKKQIESLKKGRQANSNYNRIENKSRVFNKIM